MINSQLCIARHTVTQNADHIDWTVLRGTNVFIFMDSTTHSETAAYLSNKCGASSASIVNTEAKLLAVLRAHTAVAKDCIVLISTKDLRVTGQQLDTLYKANMSKDQITVDQSAGVGVPCEEVTRCRRSERRFRNVSI